MGQNRPLLCVTPGGAIRIAVCARALAILCVCVCVSLSLSLCWGWGGGVYQISDNLSESWKSTHVYS